MCATTLVVSMLCLSRRVSCKNNHLTFFKIMICKDQLISSEVLPMGYFWFDNIESLNFVFSSCRLASTYERKGMEGTPPYW